MTTSSAESLRLALSLHDHVWPLHKMQRLDDSTEGLFSFDNTTLVDNDGNNKTCNNDSAQNHRSLCCKRGLDQRSLIEPLSQITFGFRSFLSLQFSFTNTQKASSFWCSAQLSQHSATWSAWHVVTFAFGAVAGSARRKGGTDHLSHICELSTPSQCCQQQNACDWPNFFTTTSGEVTNAHALQFHLRKRWCVFFRLFGPSAHIRVPRTISP